MGRLIDADELLKEFDPNGERLDPIFVRSRIVRQPTAYNVEKVIAELEERKGNVIIDGKIMYQENYFIDIDSAIDIVKRGGIDERT